MGVGAENYEEPSYRTSQRNKESGLLGTLQRAFYEDDIADRDAIEYNEKEDPIEEKVKIAYLSRGKKSNEAEEKRLDIYHCCEII